MGVAVAVKCSPSCAGSKPPGKRPRGSRPLSVNDLVGLLPVRGFPSFAVVAETRVQMFKLFPPTPAPSL